MNWARDKQLKNIKNHDKKRSEAELQSKCYMFCMLKQFAGGVQMSVAWILYVLTAHLVLDNSMSHDWVKVKKALSQVELDNGRPRIF